MSTWPNWTASGVLHAFRRCENGSISVFAVFAMIVIVGIAAISVDGGKFFLLRRTQQTATDFAALAAASNLSNATSLAVQASAVGPFGPSAVSAVEVGTYTQDSAIPVSRRFVPATTTPNAARVTLATQPPFVFGGVLAALTGLSASRPGFDIRTRAIAINQNLASFSLGTQLASLDGGIENAILGALLGSRLSLTASDYQALATARVDLFSFSQALNTHANLSAATYNEVLHTMVHLPQALDAVKSSLSAGGDRGVASFALAQMTTAASLSSRTLPIASLLAFGNIGNTPLTSVRPATATVSALTLVSAIIEVANGREQVSGSIGTTLPGIASIDFSLAVGEPTVTASVIAVGPQGTTLRSAQTRLRLVLTLVGVPPADLVTLPIYIEVASGSASVASVQCSIPSSPAAVLSVQPGLVDAWIGTVPASDFVDLSEAPRIGSATFVNLLGLAQVTGSARATMANASPTSVSFSSADIANGKWKTASTTAFTSSLYASLLDNLSLQVNVLGLGFGAPVGLKPAVTQTLSAATVSIDHILNQVLGAVGVTVGNAASSVSAVRCGRSLLAG